jgi:general secretion pathway protein A
MYHDFYQLRENPFNMTADPDFFFSSKCHAEGITSLCYGIDQRKGILLVTGEIGTGKTTMCRKLLRLADSKTKFAFILNPNFSEVDLLKLIIEDLGQSTRNANNKLGLIKILNDYLLSESVQGNNVVLVIDEAQNMSIRQLEQIRLLSNLETEKEKLLQIVLVGQPELQDKLRLPELRQLRQRVAIHFHIQPLPKTDIKHYIEDRINRAAFRPYMRHGIQFTSRAIDAIFRYTQGTPRTINILCDRALLAGFIKETHSIDEAIIQDCAKEVLYCEHNL